MKTVTSVVNNAVGYNTRINTGLKEVGVKSVDLYISYLLDLLKGNTTLEMKEVTAAIQNARCITIHGVL